MCTISILPLDRGGAFRLVCNRDERRTRPAARPPAVRRLGGTNAIWPADPQGGGTWIGANDAGLVMTILNRHPPAASAPGPGERSRGTIIPALLRERSLPAALRALATVPAHRFAPFTLLVFHDGELAVVRNVHRGWRVTRRTVCAPLVFTSSSLGDRRVSRPRRALFRQLVEGARSPLVGQKIFHEHVWPDRPEISVCMARADAATVSRTLVDIGRRSVRMTYVAVVPRVRAVRSAECTQPAGSRDSGVS